jgi:hypothetical protein
MLDVHDRLFTDSISGTKSPTAEKQIHSARESDLAVWHTLLSSNSRLHPPVPDPVTASRAFESISPRITKPAVIRSAGSFMGSVNIPLDHSLPRHFSTLPPLQPVPVNVSPPPSGPVYLKQFSKSCVMSRLNRPAQRSYAKTLGGLSAVPSCDN